MPSMPGWQPKQIAFLNGVTTSVLLSTTVLLLENAGFREKYRPFSTFVCSHAIISKLGHLISSIVHVMGEIPAFIWAGHLSGSKRHLSFSFFLSSPKVHGVVHLQLCVYLLGLTYIVNVVNSRTCF